jgi:hypothetical protein
MNITTVKETDTHVTVWATNLDLTGATAVLVAKAGFNNNSMDTDDEYILDSTILAPASAGLIQHILTGTLPPGGYRVEARCILANGQQVTCPNGNDKSDPSIYAGLNVMPKL